MLEANQHNAIVSVYVVPLGHHLKELPRDSNILYFLNNIPYITLRALLKLKISSLSRDIEASGFTVRPRDVVSMQLRLASSQDRRAVSSSPSKKYLEVESRRG